MKYKKSLFAGLAAVAVATAFTGCGNSIDGKYECPSDDGQKTVVIIDGNTWDNVIGDMSIVERSKESLKGTKRSMDLTVKSEKNGEVALNMTMTDNGKKETSKFMTLKKNKDNDGITITSIMGRSAEFVCNKIK